MASFDDYLAERLKDPEVRESYEDAQALDQLVDALIAHRKSSGLNQTQVAKRMGVKQPTVSGFEREDTDPRVSTLQRYARACGARVTLRLEPGPVEERKN